MVVKRSLLGHYTPMTSSRTPLQGLFDTIQTIRQGVLERGAGAEELQRAAADGTLVALLDLILPPDTFELGPRGWWLQTRSGRTLYLLDPRPEDITIGDITHGLACEGRYANQTVTPYSTAQHSMLVASILPPHLRLEGLLHDAAEAYIRDLPRGLKACLPVYKLIERGLEAAIGARFELAELSPKERALIKEADLRVLAAERRSLMKKVVGQKWRVDELGLEPLPDEPVHAIRWNRIKQEFEAAVLEEVQRREADGRKKPFSPFPRTATETP